MLQRVPALRGWLARCPSTFVRWKLLFPSLSWLERRDTLAATLSIPNLERPLILCLPFCGWLDMPCRNDLFEPRYAWHVVAFAQSDVMLWNVEVERSQIFNKFVRACFISEPCPVFLGASRADANLNALQKWYVRVLSERRKWHAILL